MLYNVHLLRVIAALLVVYFHIASSAGLHLPLAFGICGVDVFFVISGFIIAYIGSRKPDAFFTRRLIRIVPFYWSASLFVFGIAWLFPQQLRQTRADIPHLLHSLFFIPHETTYCGTFPTLILGWSLNYEMYFYALFAVALMISRRHAPLFCCALLALVSGSIWLSRTESAALGFYGASIVLEFVLGICVYYLAEWISVRAQGLRELRWLKSVLFAAILTAFVFLVVQEIWEGFGLPRFICGGLPSFLIVLGAILLERIYRVSAKNGPVLLLGEASYILYLIHPYVVYGVLRLIVGPVTGFSPFTLGLLTLVLLILPTAAAVAIHLWFEKPLMELLRRMIFRTPGAPESPVSEPPLVGPMPMGLPNNVTAGWRSMESG